ncbi:MAG: peptidylprolyl isomerase [Chloroflexota bacterium]
MFQFAAANTKLQKCGSWTRRWPRRRSATCTASSCSTARTRSARTRSASGHILFSPNNDAQNATKLAATGILAWEKAKGEADAAYAKLGADPTGFDAMARTNNDDTNSATNGGKLGYLANDGSLDAAFSAAVFASGPSPARSSRR